MNNMSDKRAKRYKCIFFDLDHTLWDYECNARETLLDLHHSYRLLERGIQFDAFHSLFRDVNFRLWEQYDRGLIDQQVIRQERFRQILEPFNAYEVQLCADLSEDYLHACPKKPHLVPFAKEMLDYLSAHYALTVVTNGFEETQGVKLLSGNIKSYFGHVVTSQKAGHKKPSREIFDYACALNDLRHHEVIMVGDNLITDIGGARNASIDTVFFNPGGIRHSDTVSHEIRCLSELQNIL